MTPAVQAAFWGIVSGAALVIGAARARKSESVHVVFCPLLPPVPPALLESRGSADPEEERRIERDQEIAQARWVGKHAAEGERLLAESKKVLERNGIPAERIQTEVTEPLDRGDELAEAIVAQARTLGCRTIAPLRDEIRRAQEDPSASDLLYIDEHLSSRALAARHRGCDCAVLPYRAEGSVIPAIESLACGTPTIVPEIGPSSDDSNETTSFLVPALGVRLPVNRSCRMKLGHELELGEIDLSEVKAGSLASVLRQAYESTAEARRARGMAGARLVHGGFTWLSVGDLIEKRREELDDGKKPFRFRFWAVVS